MSDNARQSRVRLIGGEKVAKGRSELIVPRLIPYALRKAVYDREGTYGATSLHQLHHQPRGA